MAKSGPFEPVAPLYRAAGRQVWSCRPGGTSGPPAYSLKRVGPTAADPAAADRFLAGARLQRGLAKRSAGWAAVHALGTVGADGFCVTDRFPRSAQSIVDGPDPLTSAELRTILTAVVDALIELQAWEGRPHGNLKPSNVLLGRRVRPGRVVLTDPAAVAPVVPSLTQAPDPKAVGRLLYALVTHRPHTAVAWPMMYNAPWHALGAAGPAWFHLCRALVHPLGESAPDLDELLTRIVSIRPTPRRLKRALAAVPLALALAIAGYTCRAQIPRWRAAVGRVALEGYHIIRPEHKPGRPRPKRPPPKSPYAPEPPP